MDVRDYKLDDRDRIEAFLERSGKSTIYHRTGWKAVIEKTFSHTFDYLVAEDGEGIRGVLPMVHIRSRLFGNYMVSLPYFNYGGPCAENTTAESALVQEATRRAGMRDARFIEFRSVERWGDGFPVKTGKVSMVLDLPTSAEDLWKAFPSKLRSQIRRPERDGMRARIGREEELEGFYRVFSVNMRDLGTPVYPKRFFENMLYQFPDNSWICSVYRDREVAASGFLVGYRNRMEIPWASSLRRFNRLSPNMLLYWESLRFACESGYASFDFGRSTPEEGTYRFKEQWGASPVQLYWHYWLRDKVPMPELNPRNPKYRIAISIWKKLPVPLANFIGPRIVKNLP
jgi:serine/alanine adding enzyme